MIIVYDNKIEDATLTSTYGETLQEIKNLSVAHLTSTYSMAYSSGKVEINVDFGSTGDEVKAIVLDVGTSLATTAIEAWGSDDSSFATKETFALTRTDTCYYGFLDTAKKYRYWKLVIQDSTAATVRFGHLYMGDYLYMPPIDPAAKLSYSTTSQKATSISGQVYGNKGFQFLSTEFSFPMILENGFLLDGKLCGSRKQILQMWNANENNKPIWLFIWQSSLSEYPPVFCTINQSSIDFAYSAKLSYSTSIKFMEAK